MDADTIKQEYFNELRRVEAIIITPSHYGWDVGYWTPASAAPTTSYDTAQEAAARAMQLMGLSEPVTPQNWPENIGPGAPPRSILKPDHPK